MHTCGNLLPPEPELDHISKAKAENDLCNKILFGVKFFLLISVTSEGGKGILTYKGLNHQWNKRPSEHVFFPSKLTGKSGWAFRKIPGKKLTVISEWEASPEGKGD